MTLEPPSEEEDDTVVESTESESESDPADDLFKHDQIELQKNLVSAKDPMRRRGGAVVLNQNSLHVKIGQEEERKRGNIREGAKLPEEEERKTPEHKSEKVEENHFKTSSSGERRRPVENGREERRKETKIYENCDNCAAREEVQRILEELENIKRRISEIEHDVLKRIGL